jgi:hypothetical protein
MHHPVFLTFHMAHLDPEDRRAIRRWSARTAGMCASLALLLFGTMAISILNPHAGAMERAGPTGISPVTRLVGISSAIAAEPRTGWFAPACARQDLRAFSLIEERGEAAGAPAEWLAAASLELLQARLLYLSGQDDEGVALYQNIIDFEAPVLNAGKNIEGMKQ